VEEQGNAGESSQTVEDGNKQLVLAFHGRVIDHLGIQMYQSPTAALAELISNSWDADAENVELTLPVSLGADSVITIRDDGNGMTFDECQSRFLNVGYDCRDGKAISTSKVKSRPLLGRKGIGKFAGFGIAKTITVDTISRLNGEHTVFALNLETLRGTKYIEGQTRIDTQVADGPDQNRIGEHGTTFTLSSLELKRAPSILQFTRSMSRRFLLAERSSDFSVKVNGDALPVDIDSGQEEYVFPRDYAAGEMPTGMSIDAAGWAVESLPAGRTIKWRIAFFEEPIKEDDLRGVSIFANGKLAQRPFTFNIVGGISAQQGLEYLTGKVEADYLDQLTHDLIATERQRINWEDQDALPLLDWGKERVEALCKIWKSRRAEGKLKAMEVKLTPFAMRLGGLQSSERKTLRTALTKLAQINSLTTKQFELLGDAILTSWEAGRLKELINDLANSPEMSADKLIELLVEANVLTALNTHEAIKTKLTIVEELRRLVEKKELENAVRDYIATNPWLISPQWETFKKEISLKKLIKDLLNSKKIDPAKDWDRRIDLLLASGDRLLILEFMQPDKKIDMDHITRFKYYVATVRNYLTGNTGQPLRHCTGYLVANKIVNDPAIHQMIQDEVKNDLYYLDWEMLLYTSEKQYEEFSEILKERSPEDSRLSRL
jgi:hypothetical protein